MSYHARALAAFLAILACGVVVDAAATSSLGIDQDNHFAQSDYFASDEERMAMDASDGDDSHVWGTGVIATGNSQDWSRFADDLETYSGAISNADPARWTVHVSMSAWAAANLGSGDAEACGVWAIDYVKLAGDIYEVDGVLVAGGLYEVRDPDSDELLDDYVVFQAGGTKYLIPQYANSNGHILAETVLAPGPHTIIEHVFGPTLSFTLNHFGQMKIKTDGGQGNTPVTTQIQENSGERDSVIGFVEAHDEGASPTLIESYDIN